MNGPLNPNESIRIEAYQRIDEALARHANSMLVLKSERNNLAYISRLPPEILSRIFAFAQSKNLFKSPRPSRWIKLTHVCRRWRQVALTSPNLWVNLPLGNLRWLEESLRRSKLADLVVISWTEPLSKKIISGLELALKHISRIKHLLIVLDSTTWKNIRKQLPKSTPRLEYLALLSCKGSIYLSDEVLCDANRLRHLELARCRINWDSPLCLLRSLTHLSLMNLPQTSKPTGKQFVDAMRRMPDLEVLRLEDALPVDGTLWTSDCVHFIRLRSLALKSMNVETEIFFRCFTFPPTAILEVVCYLKGPHHSGTEFSGVVFGLSKSYSPKLSDSHFQTLIFFYHMGAQSVYIRLFKDVLGDEQMLNHHDITPALHVAFRFTGGPSEEGVRELFNAIFDSAIPLQDIRRIHMGNLGPVFKADMLANKFGRLPRLHSVMTGRLSSRLFFEALNVRLKIEDTGSIILPKKLSFPKLSSIYIHDTNFEHQRENVWPSVLSFRSLRDCLMSRRKFGAAINELTLKNCHELPENTATLLKGIVANVRIVNDPEEEQDIQQVSDSDTESETESDTEEDSEGEEDPEEEIGEEETGEEETEEETEGEEDW